MNEQTTTNTAAHDEPLAVLPPVDDDAAGREAVREKMADALTPGFQVEFDPDEAERVGAFVEDALSEQDAAASGDDLVEVDGALEPAFLDDEGPSADIPPFITTTNARELYDLRPGETVAQAAGQGVKGFFVQVGRFKQERQGSFKGLRNVLHHL